MILGRLPVCTFIKSAYLFVNIMRMMLAVIFSNLVLSLDFSLASVNNHFRVLTIGVETALLTNKREHLNYQTTARSISFL